MVRTRVVVALIVILLAGGGAFLIFSPYLTGDDYLKDFFLQQLEQSFGRKIDVHRIKLVLFPRIRLELTQVAIHDQNSDDVLLSAKKLDLVLRFLPLLRKQVVGKRVLIEEPTLTLRRNPSGHWNLLDQVVQGGPADQDAIQTISRIFRIREATLINGKLIIIDDARPDGTRSMTLESVEASLVIRAERGQADLHVSAGHAGGKGLSTISLIGTISTAPRQTLAIDDSSASQATLQFDGTLEAANLNLREVADLFGPRPVPEHLQGAVNMHSHVRAVPGVAGYDVVLSDLSASLEHLRLTGQASLSGLLTPQPTFAFTFAAPPIQLSQLLTTVPAEWVHPRLPAIIQERQIDGLLEVVSATVTGSSVAGPQLSLTGEFRVKQGQALIGGSHVPAKDLAAVVSVEAGRLRVSNLSGLYGTIHMNESKALVSFLEGGPWLEMDITGEMAAADLLQFLAKTVKSQQLSRVLAASREVEGNAAPTFRMVGPLDQQGGVTFAGGEITVRRVSLTHPSLPERVTALQGRFVLSDGGTLFDQVTGQFGNLALQISGGITGGSGSTFQDFLIRVNGDADHMVKLLPSKAIPAGMIDGLVNGAVVLTGPTVSPHIRGEVVLTESKVTLPGLVEKPIGAQATVEFEGMIPQGSGVLLDRLELSVPPIRLPVKGKIQLGERFSIDGALSTGTLSLSRVPEWIAKGGFEAGNIELSLDMKGKGLDWKAWRTTGWLALTNGLMNAKGTEGPIQDLYLRVHFVKNGAEIKRLSFRLFDSDVALEGTIRNWAVKPTIIAKIESSQMDLDLLIPKGQRSAIREFLETLAATSKVQATVSMTRGHYKHLKFGSLSARIMIQDGVLDLDRVSGQSTNGEVAGRIVMQLPRNEPADAELSVRATGLLVEDVLKFLGPKEGMATGEARMTGTIRGHGKNPHGLYPTLNGKVDVLLENGRIFKSEKRAVWKIISILNLPAVLQGKVDLEKDGLPYNKISARVLARNGLFETENMIIDSPIVKITAAGNYDLPTDQIDMVWAVSPFGSYSQFLKTIPLFGRLFAGDRKGVATALFSVKGSIEDPEVTYLPMKSFATGLTGLAHLAFDILKNTVMLPIDLITPDEEKAAEKDTILAPEPVPSAP
ncbi:MAG TPA: AsmA-like C-terminal domain-containing protein [Nitrospiraceae bacterium]|nr:AsmA-like C-terminal domain-containing protein [Nitrospiraceae bacterium]